MALPTSIEKLRFRLVALVAAGPVANLLLAGAVLISHRFPELIDIGRFTSQIVIAPAFLAANLLGLLQNLWPRDVPSVQGKLATDGKLLLRILFEGREVIEESHAAWFAMEGSELHEHENTTGSLTWLDRGLAQYPHSELLHSWRGVIPLELGRFAEAREVFLGMLARDNKAPEMRALFQNNIAYVNAMLQDPNLLEEADRFSQAAMSTVGWVPAVQGTRGTVLVEKGELEDGIRLLLTAKQGADQAGAKAQNACVISIAHARQGSLDEARTYRDEAARLRPDCFLLERADKAIAYQSQQEPR